METFQAVYLDDHWRTPLRKLEHAQLVLVFGERTLANNKAIQSDLHKHFPHAAIIGCTTSGEIDGAVIYEGSLVITAVQFAHTKIAVHSASIIDSSETQVAATLASELSHDDLKHVLIFSDGQLVNGTLLVDELKKLLPDAVNITGGLAGDDLRFAETIVWHNEISESGLIVICGFYGSGLIVGFGSMGGWDCFGPERLVTSSVGNVLETLDGKPALSLYKKYLGDYVQSLPSSALLFPLNVKRKDGSGSVTRSIINIDESKGTMTFAGDIPENSYVQLMRANFDRVIDGAEQAAENALRYMAEYPKGKGLVLIVSCVGRKMILKGRTEDELEAVTEVFGEDWAYTGFYSYGEISPLASSDSCVLQNQTMTITAFLELNA